MNDDEHAALEHLCCEFADEIDETITEYHEKGVPMKTLLADLEYIVGDERENLK